MAKNELVSLALLYDAPKHAYALNAIIKDIGLEHWARISRASIYSTLSRLEKAGCVRVAVRRVGKMPPRKEYAITARGKRRLHDELAAALRSGPDPESPFPLAVSFLFGMPAREAIEHCSARIAGLRGVLKHLEEEHADYEGCEVQVALIVIRAARKHIRVEIDSTQELITLLRKRPKYYDELLARMKEHYRY